MKWKKMNQYLVLPKAGSSVSFGIMPKKKKKKMNDYRMLITMFLISKVGEDTAISTRKLSEMLGSSKDVNCRASRKHHKSYINSREVVHDISVY